MKFTDTGRPATAVIRAEEDVAKMVNVLAVHWGVTTSTICSSILRNALEEEYERVVEIMLMNRAKR